MYTAAILDQFRDSLVWLQDTLKTVPDDRAAEQFPGIVNHPAWTMTHLAISLDFACTFLGQPFRCPEAWRNIAMPESKPVADRAIYPPLAESTAKLAELHTSMDALVRNADPAMFEQPSPEFIRSFAPTLGHIISYMLLAHENYHLAQISIWKKAAGL